MKSQTRVERVDEKKRREKSDSAGEIRTWVLGLSDEDEERAIQGINPSCSYTNVSVLAHF